MDFLTIPAEFFAIKELNKTEIDVLAIYKFRTKGKYGKCTMSNQEIADFLHMSRRNVIDIKNHLEELGFIKTGKGKEVWFIGIEKGEAEITPKVKQSSSQECNTVHSKGEAEITPKVKQSSLINVKKNKEEKEEIKKDLSGQGKTNFDLILDTIPDITAEKKEFLLTKYPDKISVMNKLTMSDNKIREQGRIISALLIKEFPVEKKDEKPIIPIKRDYSWADML